MIIPGLTSVTFRNRTPQEVVRMALKAGLMGIEWGGDIHVPVGDVNQAAKVFGLTRNSGLQVSAYGSYYTVGKSSDDGIRFDDVLQTAEALNAPVIRIWAGENGSGESTQKYRRMVLDETLKIADEAGRSGIGLAFEFHENTLNDSYEACCELLTDLNHPVVNTFWQPVHGAGPDINGAGIDLILPWIVGVHIFHWWPKAEIRLPLRHGEGDWKEYLYRLSGLSRKIFGNLEFIKDNSQEQFFNDASTLLELTGYNNINGGREINGSV
ncbi:MAG TPA: TIM barrel protein [Bacteroidales bacterium]|nr:TIM barrel protein [Bacteroidales bacterium]